MIHKHFDGTTAQLKQRVRAKKRFRKKQQEKRRYRERAIAKDEKCEPKNLKTS